MKGKNTQSKLRIFNKIKLLLYFLSNASVRERDVLIALRKNSKHDYSPSTIRENAPQGVHRIAFFDAVKRKNMHLAFKMLGRLREQDHDLGELQYLESLAYFYSNEFDKAVEYSSAVPIHSIDRPNANLIMLESLAMQGCISDFTTKISSVECSEIPIFFVMHLAQSLVRNAPEPVEALKQVVGLPQFGEGLEINDFRSYSIFNRYSCNLAIQWVEHMRNQNMVKLATEQSESLALGDQEDDLFSDILLRVQAAVSIDQELFSNLMDAEIDDAYKVIVKRLINHRDHSIQDFVQALQAQWRIGEREVFLENIMRSLDQLGKQTDIEFQQILGWAYQEALVQNRKSDANKIRPYLQSSASTEVQLDKSALGPTLQRIERKLSAMGRVGLRAANAHLKYAELPENAWHDAGMVSLGFFRIVELEMNSQIVIPAMRHVDINYISNELDALANDTSNSGRKAVEFWKKLFPQIKNAKIKGKGLDLGALEVFFRKLNVASGPDKLVKDHLFKLLRGRLSDLGIEALLAGELADLIGEDVREIYRNPAAHTRYVTLNTAQMSRSYVLSVLEKLFLFVLQEKNEPTIH